MWISFIMKERNPWLSIFIRSPVMQGNSGRDLVARPWQSLPQSAMTAERLLQMFKPIFGRLLVSVMRRTKPRNRMPDGDVGLTIPRRAPSFWTGMRAYVE